MDNEPIEWRNSKVLKVSGVTARPGTFTSQGGKTIPFTSELCQKLFSDSPTLIPTYLTHEDRDACGFLYKLGYNKDDDTIHYEGFVFDPIKQQRIMSDGFNAVSPEIEFNKDEDGQYTSGIITGNAFVRNPAITGTKVDANFVAFSAPIKEQIEQTKLSDDIKDKMYNQFKMYFEKKDGNDMVNYTMKSNPDGTYAFIPTSTEPIVHNFSAEDVAKLKADHAAEIMTLKSKIESFEAQSVAPVQVPAVMPVTPQITTPIAAPVAPVVAPANDEFKVKYEALLNEKANALVGELRGIGLKEPDKIGVGLTAEQRINVLTSVKENVLKTSPVTTAAVPIVTPAPVSTSESKMAELMKANGIGDQFKKYLQPKVS